VLDRPRWRDLLPLKLSVWVYLSVRNLPQTVQERRGQRSKRPRWSSLSWRRRRRRRPTTPTTRPPPSRTSSTRWTTGCRSAESPRRRSEDQAVPPPLTRRPDAALCFQAADWTEEELSLLSRLMVKFPGGAPGRWEKIAQDLGRSVTEVR
ncbi:unnamed protein product, partial [Tetraodon nigroviridis]